MSRFALWQLAAAAAAAIVGAPAASGEPFVFRQSVVTGLPAGDWTPVGIDWMGDAAMDLFVIQPAEALPAMFGTNSGGDFDFVYVGGFIDPTARLFAGDFNGDGLADLLYYFPSSGRLLVGLRNSSGGIGPFTEWTALSAGSSWELVVGDFAGDARDEVVAYFTAPGAPSTGFLYLGSSDGTRFFWTYAGTVPSTDVTWKLTAGRFSAGTNDWLAGYNPSTDSVWVGFHNFVVFSFVEWGQTSSLVSQVDRLLAGDFNRDGRSDVLGYEVASGELVVGLSNGTGFSFQDWGTMPATGAWRLETGEFSGRTQSDVVGYHVATGAIWVGDNQQHQCSNGFDDDLDGLADHPADPQCSSPADYTENNSCGLGAELVLVPALLARRRRRRSIR